MPAWYEVAGLGALAKRAITRAHRRVAALRRPHAGDVRLRALLDSQDAVISCRDRDGNLTFVNRAFCRTFGVDADAVLGTSYGASMVDGWTADTTAARNGQQPRRFEQKTTTASGERWFAFEQHVIEGKSGPEVFCIGRDTTDEHAAQARLAAARDQADAASAAKSSFLAATSHEIRTPMNGILGMSALLLDTELSAEQKAYTSAIDRSARALLALVDDILDFSKIEAGKLEIVTAPFAIDECVQGVVELMDPKAREKGIELAWRIDPDLPKFVVGDETRVRQIVLNLVGNAVKFTDVGGVVVRVSRAPGHIADANSKDLPLSIAVTDTGIGIAPTDVPALFVEFERRDEAIRRRSAGTGLGLVISRRLARAMGGDITVESQPGVGSTFKAQLSLKAVAGSAPALLRPAHLPSRHVLIVSDRQLERKVLQETLTSVGIRVAGASTDAAAAVIADALRTSTPFDTIIADSPIGPDRAQSLFALASQAGSRTVRGIVLIDVPGKVGLAPFRASGFDAYLVRPVRPVSLLAQVVGPLASQGSDKPSPASAPGHMGSPLAGRHILLVEDNDVNALLAKCVIERTGACVVTARNGHEAKLYCEAAISGSEPPFDVVLTDIHMPGADGFETTRSLRQMYAAAGKPCPPLVALTASAFAEDRQRCLDGGLDDYLAKPFERTELEALLEKWCAAGERRRDHSLDDRAA